jgi:hypothetical protein
MAFQVAFGSAYQSLSMEQIGLCQYSFQALPPYFTVNTAARAIGPTDCRGVLPKAESTMKDLLNKGSVPNWWVSSLWGQGLGDSVNGSIPNASRHGTIGLTLIKSFEQSLQPLPFHQFNSSRGREETTV